VEELGSFGEDGWGCRAAILGDGGHLRVAELGSFGQNGAESGVIRVEGDAWRVQRVEPAEKAMIGRQSLSPAFIIAAGNQED
jgi:hypothetical protein